MFSLPLSTPLPRRGGTAANEGSRVHPKWARARQEVSGAPRSTRSSDGASVVKGPLEVPQLVVVVQVPVKPPGAVVLLNRQ